MFCLLLSYQSSLLRDRLEVLQNIPDLTWTPQMPKFFLNKSQTQVDKYFSPKQPHQRLPKQVQRGEARPHVFQQVPTKFDWSLVKPECVDYVESMDDCVAIEVFASINMLNDIACINSMGKKRVQYSQQYLISCFSEGKGCDMNSGLDVNIFMEHLKAPYGTVPASCVSYTSGKSGKVSKCPVACDDGSQMPTRTTIHSYAAVSWDDGEWTALQENLVQAATMDGPIQVSFLAYDDLQFYSTGVYMHRFGNLIGEFSGEVMGWGAENGVKFWKLKMPFGSEWGENGYLRIAQAELENKYWSFTM